MNHTTQDNRIATVRDAGGGRRAHERSAILRRAENRVTLWERLPNWVQIGLILLALAACVAFAGPGLDADYERQSAMGQRAARGEGAGR